MLAAVSGYRSDVRDDLIQRTGGVGVAQPAKRHFFCQQDALVTKTTTDIGSNDMDNLDQGPGTPPCTPHDMRHLSCTVDDELLKPCIHSAITPRPSIGAMHCRAVRNSRSRTRRNRRNITNIDKTLKEYVVAPFDYRPFLARLEHVDRGSSRSRPRPARRGLSLVRACPPRKCQQSHQRGTLSPATAGCTDDLKQAMPKPLGSAAHP